MIYISQHLCAIITKSHVHSYFYPFSKLSPAAHLCVCTYLSTYHTNSSFTSDSPPRDSVHGVKSEHSPTLTLPLIFLQIGWLLLVVRETLAARGLINKYFSYLKPPL